MWHPTTSHINHHFIRIHDRFVVQPQLTPPPSQALLTTTVTTADDAKDDIGVHVQLLRGL